jgi:nitrite reductase/ring-hydroxylating ferredoxin subunit
MDRRAFLESLSVGAAFALTATCLQSCKSDSDSPTPSGVDFTLEISEISTTTNFVIKNGVVVAKDTSGNYVAATQKCSHEGNIAVSYNKSANEFQCSVHGARFSTVGKGLNDFGNKGLTVYKTQLTGTTLRVFS